MYFVVFFSERIKKEGGKLDQTPPVEEKLPLKLGRSTKTTTQLVEKRGVEKKTDETL